MSKEERRAEAARDKNVPINISQEVWNLCNAVIRFREHVHFPGAVYGDSGRERASSGVRTGKRHGGGVNADEFMMREEDGTFNHTLPRCRTEQRVDWEKIRARRAAMGEVYVEGVEPNEEEEIRWDEEHKRDSLSTGQRKKVAQEVGFDRLVFALEATSAQTMEQNKDHLRFEKERHIEAMKVARERLQLEVRNADRYDSYKQKELEHKKKELEVKERELVLAEATVVSNNQTIQTLTRVLAALAVPNMPDA